MNRKILLLATAVFVSATPACLEDITGTRPLSLSITADNANPAVAEDLTVSFEASGTGMIGVTIDFGDGTIDSTAYSLRPLEVSGFAVHAYSAPGTFTVRGVARAQAGSTSQELTVTVN